MKTLFIITFILVFALSTVLFVQAEEKPRGKEPTKVDIGNMLIIYGGVNYRINDLPYGSIGFGFDFQLGNNVLFSPGIKIFQTQVTAGTNYSGAIDVEGGEINYIDVDLALKLFPHKKWWIAGGFIYEAFRNGYYIDNNGTDTLFVDLSSTDQSNNLGLQVSTGLYSSIRTNVYIVPSFSVHYNLPTTSGYSFSSSDIIFSIDFGMGIQM